MKKDIIRQLKGLRNGTVSPRKEWLESNRALLLSQIKNTLPTNNKTAPKPFANVWSFLSHFFPRSVVNNVMRPAAALVIALAIITSSSIGAVDAAYEALPGDQFGYPVKRNLEKIQAGVVSLLGSSNDQMKLHMEFAKRRAGEATKIIAISKTEPNRLSQVVSAVADLKSELNSVNQKLQQSSNDGTDSLAAQAVTDVQRDSDQLKNTLQDVKDTLAASSSPQNDALSKEVSETRDLVKDVSVKAVEVIVTKHLEGEISKEEVQKVIDTSLQSAASDVGAVKQNVDDVKTAVDAAKTDVKGLIDDVGKKADGSIGTSTARATAQLNVVVQQTNAAALQTQAASADVSQKTSEVQALLSNGDLSQVVDKLREVNQVTKDAEKISDSALVTAQTVLPIVGVIKDNSLPAATSSLGIVSTTLSTINAFPTVTGTPAVTGTIRISSSSPTTSTTVKSASTTNIIKK